MLSYLACCACSMWCIHEARLTASGSCFKAAPSPGGIPCIVPNISRGFPEFSEDSFYDFSTLKGQTDTWKYLKDTSY